MMKRYLQALMVCLAALMWQGCSDDTSGNDSKGVQTSYTVAVLVPLSGETAEQWRNTVDWAVSKHYEDGIDFNSYNLIYQNTKY